MTTGLSGIAERVWPVLLFLALIQVVADLCDEAGLFDVSAHVASRVARGSRLRLFLLFVVLATVATWLLSIDTTAVLLTPIGLALASELGITALPFAFASVWLANSASLLLPVSNLTNLLAQERLDLSATAFMGATWAPQLAVIAVVGVVLLLRHRRALTGSYDVPRDLPAHDRVLLWLAAAVVVLIGPGIVLGAPAWAVALAASVVLVAGFAVR
ncbi:MAG: arsenic transporter, partial [Marmoricola sp.]|nr:arsenic transporter [Marmoricola sp.]